MKSVIDVGIQENTANDTTHTSVPAVESGLSQNVTTANACSVLNALCSPHRTNPNPTCEKDCRFSYGVSMTTAMYFTPVYDKYGNNLNPDGNTTSGEVSCSVCGKKWTYSTQYGQTKYKEIEK